MFSEGFEKIESACFSGYRALKLPFSPSMGNGVYARLLDRLEGELDRLLERGVKTYYCGVCDGFDLICGELLLPRVARGEAELVSVVPFSGQEQGFSEYWKRKYFEVIEGSSKVVTLFDSFFKGAYMSRNRYLVDHSELLLAYYDGKSGGTEQTFRYAIEQKLKIINIANTREK